MYCYYHMRATANPPDTAPRRIWITKCGPACADASVQFAGPSAKLACVHGIRQRIMGDMCIHMFDMVRWMMDLGWPKRVSSAGGILWTKRARRIFPYAIAVFDYGDLQCNWNQRSWAPHGSDPNYSWGATLFGEKGTLSSVMSYDFIPNNGQRVHKDVTYELEQYPEDKTEKDLEKHVRRQSALTCVISWNDRCALEASRRYRAGLHFDGQLHPGEYGMKLERTLTWDAAKQRVVGDEEANRLLQRTYRGPWVHPLLQKFRIWSFVCTHTVHDTKTQIR